MNKNNSSCRFIMIELYYKIDKDLVEPLQNHNYDFEGVLSL